MLQKLKNLFIAHAGNDFRPGFLERMSAGIMLVLILLSFAMANIQSLMWIGSDWLVSTILPSVIVDLTNEERTDEQMGSLRRSAVLDAAAKLKAADMAANEYFSHYSPTGVSPWYWFDTAGYNYLHAGENLAVHFTDSEKVVEAWMESPSHRANIMNGNYTEIGVGTARGEYQGYPTIYVVQLFGTPRAQRGVAGANTANSDITIETVALASAPSDIAQATVETSPVEEKEVQPDPEPAPAPVTPPAVSEQPKESVVLTTDLATTSREGVPATIEEASSGNSGNSVPLPLRSATASHMWLQMVYAVLAGIVILSLSTSLVFAWKQHHPAQAAYAGGLLTVMALLLYIHMNLTSSVTII